MLNRGRGYFYTALLWLWLGSPSLSNAWSEKPAPLPFFAFPHAFTRFIPSSQPLPPAIFGINAIDKDVRYAMLFLKQSEYPLSPELPPLPPRTSDLLLPYNDSEARFIYRVLVKAAERRELDENKIDAALEAAIAANEIRESKRYSIFNFLHWCFDAGQNIFVTDEIGRTDSAIWPSHPIEVVSALLYMRDHFVGQTVHAFLGMHYPTGGEKAEVDIVVVNEKDEVVGIAESKSTRGTGALTHALEQIGRIQLALACATEFDPVATEAPPELTSQRRRGLENRLPRTPAKEFSRRSRY